jgi:hypothetical protein
VNLKIGRTTMKALTTLMVTSLFAASANAVDIYHGLADGNPDIAPWQTTVADGMTGVQPGIGDDLRWARGGSESALFRPTSKPAASSGRVDIYGAFQSQELGTGGY